MSKPFGALHAIAIAILLFTAWYGLTLYEGMPDPVPVHWDLSGEADRWAPKSVGNVFGPLFIGLVMVISMVVINRFLRRSQTFIGNAEGEMYDALFGYINLSLAVTFAWVAITGWTGTSLGPLFFAMVLLGGVPVFIIIGVYYRRVTAERKQLETAGDPSTDKQFWRAGMVYSNKDDPRLFVPRPPHLGFGSTINMGHPSARAIIVGFVVFIALFIGIVEVL